MTFSISLSIKSFLSKASFISGILKKRISALSPFILGYHRIVSPSEVGYFLQPGMYVRPETFRMHMRFLKDNFIVISLKELIEGDITNPRHKPVCVITFDDGWSDFYQNAFPVLQQLSLPATVFLPTDFINTNHEFWTDRLSRMLGGKRVFLNNTPEMEPQFLSVMNSILSLKGQMGRRVEMAVNSLKSLSPINRDIVLHSLAAYFENDLNKNKHRDFLTWEEIKTMKDSGVVAFGSHTASHPILTTITDHQIIGELEKSRSELLSHNAADASFIPFCYPNGNHTPHIEALVQSSGYAAAITTQPGINSLSTDQYRLCRTLVHQDISSNIPLFAARMSNFI